MKIGFRTPSLAGRIAARTSVGRFLRHSLGLKAPKGFGWLTDPRRAAYNRIYARTTVDPVKLATRAVARRRRAGFASTALSVLALVAIVALAIAGAR